MKPKISIILPTNRLNKDALPEITRIQIGLKKYNFDNINIFNKEYIPLIKNRIKDVNHYLEVTLNSLANQKFKDFEIIISHRYPEDSLEVVKKYPDLNITLIREKPSIWHKLDKKYATLCNNINTAVIHSKGDLLWRLDDLTFFNDYTIGEMWNFWKQGAYATSKSIRHIWFSEDINNIEPISERVGPFKWKLEQFKWLGIYKSLDNPQKSNLPIAKNKCWGYSSTISKDDFLDINGQDEVYDGAICGTDMDLGNRLSMISKYPRYISNSLIYEITDKPYKYSLRDDVVLRNICGQDIIGSIRNIQGNSWKPNNKEMRRYKKWHLQNKGILDKNWDKFLDVPYLDMEMEYKLKRLGEIVYANNDR